MIDLYKRVTAPVGWSLYAIPLRLIVGFGFMEHGYAKLARGTESFAAILHALGVPALRCSRGLRSSSNCSADWRSCSER